MGFKVKLLLCSWLMIATLTLAATYQTDLSTINITVDKLVVRPAETVLVNIEMTHKKNWHSYWKNPGDSGLGTSIDLNLPEGFDQLDIIWPAPSIFSLGPLVNYGYDQTVSLIVPVQINQRVEPGSYNLNGKLNWLVCKESCIPESIQLSIPIMVGPTTVYSDQADSIISYLSTIMYDELEITQQPTETGVRLMIPMNQQSVGDKPYFFAEQQGVVNYKANQIVEMTKDGFSLSIETSGPTKKLSGIITFANRQPIYVTTESPSHPISMLVYILWLAFAGGLVLNVMPCVLPILSLKLLSILDKTKVEQALIRRQALAYTLGVLVSFLMIVTLLIGLKSIGLQLGWGFQLQSPLFVFLLFILMLAVGLNFNDRLPLPSLFHNLPASFSSLHYKVTSKSSFKDFFTGILAVVVATPCTAPFMATAIGFALTQSTLIMVAIFLALGLGFSFPFLAIAYIPVLQSLLPKPGQWMVSLKHILAIPMYLTAIWLLWVVKQQVGSIVWLLGSIAALNLVTIAWLTTFKAKLSKVAKYMLILILCLLSFQVSQINPPTSDSNIEQFTALNNLLEKKQHILVDVTAAWCLTCKVNEQTVLYTPEIQSFLKDNNVTLITLDWTDYDENITAFLKQHNRVGVPLYIYYNENGSPTILPQLLTKDTVKSIIKEKSQ